MNYLLIFLNFFSVFSIFSFKIKLGKNIDKFIFDEWESEKNKQYSDSYEIDGGVKKIVNETFLLLEGYFKEDYNFFVSSCYIDKSKNIVYDLTHGNHDEINFIINFSKDNPKYQIKIIELEADKSNKNITNDYDFTEDDDLDIKTKLFLTDEQINDKKKFQDMKKRIKDLLQNFEERNKKWALFKVKIKDDKFEKYFYCNNIESIINIGGIFDKDIEEIEIIKSNCEDIYSLFCFTSQCYHLKKIDLTNLKTKEDIDINNMFLNCKNLKEVIFPKGLKVDNIALLFKNSNNIEKINFEDLVIDNLYSMVSLCNGSKMKKLKFPKCKINKSTKIILYKKDMTGEKMNEGILTNSDLEEIDLSNVEFEEGAGKDMLKNNTLKKLILPENMKNLSEQSLKDILNNSHIKTVKICEYELNIDEYDKIELFIKNPEEYLISMMKKLFYNGCNNEDYGYNKFKYKNEDNLKSNSSFSCFSQFFKCCCCCNSQR